MDPQGGIKILRYGVSNYVQVEKECLSFESTGIILCLYKYGTVRYRVLDLVEEI